MSKSNPSKAIFVDDSADVIKEKMKSTACTDDINGNPIFDYIKYLILPWFNSIDIEGKNFKNSKEIEKEFEKFDKTKLRSTVADYFIKMLEPVRKHFQEYDLKDLEQRVLSYKSLSKYKV